MTASLTSTAPWYRQQYLDQAGNPLSGGKIYFYAAGSQVKKNIWLDLTETNRASNPLGLDSSGVPLQQYYLESGLYDIAIYNVNNELIDTLYDIESAGGSGSSATSNAPIETCDLTQCSPYLKLLPNAPLGVLMHTNIELTISSICIPIIAGTTAGIGLMVSIYVPVETGDTLSGITFNKLWSGTGTTSLNEEMVRIDVDDIVVNGWYILAIGHNNANYNPIIAAYQNLDYIFDETNTNISFSQDASTTMLAGVWQDTFTPSHNTNSPIVPYLKIGGIGTGVTTGITGTYEVKLNSNDNTPNYLANKFIQGDNVIISTVVVDGIAKLSIASTVAQSVANNKIADIANPCVDDDVLLYAAKEAVNINSIQLYIVGDTAESISVSIYKQTARNGTNLAIATGTVSDYAAGSSITINEALAIGDLLILKITSVTGSPILLEAVTYFGSALTGTTEEIVEETTTATIAGDADYKVKLTSGDSTPNYLALKALAGDGIAITEVVDNAINKLKISASTSLTAANNKIAIINSPTTADKILLYRANTSVNINTIQLYIIGGTNAQISVAIYKQTTRNVTSTAIATGTVSDYATGSSITVNEALASGDLLMLGVTMSSGSPTQLEAVTYFGGELN